MKVFLDTNILIDYLLKRHPFYDSAKKVFDMCLYKIDGYVTPHFLVLKILCRTNSQFFQEVIT